MSWLERVPSYKEQQQKLKDRELATYGFLGYPLLQTADVAVYRANAVPVGQDQVAHLELSREIVRRFNHLYGGGREVLPEPRPLLAPVPKILGLDGRKMSKSLGNTVDPLKVMETYGADIIRLWALSVDFTEDHRIGLSGKSRSKTNPESS